MNLKHEKSKNPLVVLVQTLWKYSKGYRPWVIFYAVLAFTALGLHLLTPLVIRALVNSVQNSTGQQIINNSSFWLGVYVAIGLLFWFLHGPSRVIENIIAFRVKRAFQTALFRRVTALPVKWHKDHHSGETIDQIAKATQALNDFTQTSFELLHLSMRYIGSLCILAWFMPLAAVIILCTSMLVALVIYCYDRKLIPQYRSLNKSFNQVAAAIQDYLTNVSTVISLRLEDRVTREVNERTDSILALYKRNCVTNEFKWFSTSILVDLTQVAVLFGYIFINVREANVIEIGTLYALWEYLKHIGESFFQFTWKYGDLVVKGTRVSAIDHIDKAFEQEVEAQELATLPKAWQNLQIQNLNFSHDSEDEDSSAQVQDANFVLQRGKSYAFVGESGSGKSTTLGLLRGLHKANKVAVTCDGQIMSLGLAHVSHVTTLIPQDPEIFSDTIRFNVTMGIEAPEAAVLAALELARFSEVLARLPKGLETSIAEKGVSLSGGEKQRLALARGIFFVDESASDLILLDEPTSSVDPYNESIIYENLLKLYRDRCVVSAIHKLHLLPLFDEIVLFDKGRIVARGDYEYLQSESLVFRRLTCNLAEATK